MIWNYEKNVIEQAETLPFLFLLGLLESQFLQFTAQQMSIVKWNIVVGEFFFVVAMVGILIG